MDLLRPIVAASAVTLTLLGAGQSVGRAADAATTLPPPDSLSSRTWSAPDNAPRYELMSGWYLRGDAMYRWNDLKNASAAAGFADPIGSSLVKGYAFGLGAGFRNKWFRSDVTVDYAGKENYQGTVATPNDVTAKIQTSTALLNAYADLGTWSRFTPYIGAGAGVARVVVSDFNSAVTPPFTGAPARTQWNLAWAGMAGMAFALSRNIQLDIGYRYLNYGDVKTSDGPGGHLTFKKVAAQEVRAGLRWSFDDLPGIQ